MESALIISPSIAFAIFMDNSVLPTAVGPVITTNGFIYTPKLFV